ncbi:MAG: ATP-binding protein [Candidatus Brockarchaeota archaeon]|nr:ATP-binding protein [Candidatus Brockarchaeota archaeon]
MNAQEARSKYFTDFGGRFRARLSSVQASGTAAAPSETTGVSAKYQCRIKAEYQKDLMGLLEEGMLLAVRNFKSPKTGAGGRYTLLEISRIGPEHYGLKGLSDSSYYPYQFEVIEQTVDDWGTDDKAIMMILMNAIPLNYDLAIDENGECRYVKGFTYPVIAEEVYVLSKETIHQMYNRPVLERMGRNWKKIETSHLAREDCRLGTIKMFEAEGESVPIYVDFERLVRYHFGIFGFTGSGKSNLMSNILRRLIYHSKDVKVVIFDISMEYPFLLQDVLADPKIPSKVVLETPIEDAGQLYKVVVKPRGFEKDERAKRSFEEIMRQGKVGYYAEPTSTTPTYEDVFRQFEMLRQENEGKATNLEAIDAVQRAVTGYMRERRLQRGMAIDEGFVDFLSGEAAKAVEKYKIWKGGSLYAWAATRSELKERIGLGGGEKEGGSYDVQGITEAIESEARLVCLSIVDPNAIKSLAIELSRKVLTERKREFKVEPSILFIFDEAQEFIPSHDRARGIERECTVQVETLLRQGRKYGLGGCIATQRIAYLNTNALQQLHTYFIGPMPRPYDRSLVSNTFTIDQGILEKTLEFAPGEWLLSSYVATGIENVPIFVKADNSELEIERFLG